MSLNSDEQDFLDALKATQKRPSSRDRTADTDKNNPKRPAVSGLTMADATANNEKLCKVNKQANNGDTRRKADRNLLLSTAATFDDNELWRMGEAKNTTKNKRSRVNLFLKWLEYRGKKLPVIPRWVQHWVAHLTLCEYKDPAVYSSTVWMWLCDIPDPGESNRLVESATILLNIADVEEQITRTIKKCKCTKAPLLGAARDEEASLSKKQRCLAALMSLLGNRCDTMASASKSNIIINREDMDKNKHYVYFQVAEDKVQEAKGRWQKFYCNCEGNAKKDRMWCPLHGEEPLQKEWFPIHRSEWEKIAQLLKGTTHSFRRTLAMTLRDNAQDLSTTVAVTHMGWEEKGKMWGEYTKDHHKWAEEKMEVIPVTGIVRYLKEQSSNMEKGHKFKKTKSLKKGKKTIYFKDLKSRLAKTGRTGLGAKLKTVTIYGAEGETASASTTKSKPTKMAKMGSKKKPIGEISEESSSDSGDGSSESES